MLFAFQHDKLEGGGTRGGGKKWRKETGDPGVMACVGLGRKLIDCVRRWIWVGFGGLWRRSI